VVLVLIKLGEAFPLKKNGVLILSHLQSVGKVKVDDVTSIIYMFYFGLKYFVDWLVYPLIIHINNIFFSTEEIKVHLNFGVKNDQPKEHTRPEYSGFLNCCGHFVLN